MKVIADAQNQDYYVHRAVEEVYAGNFITAIQILTLAIINQ